MRLKTLILGIVIFFAAFVGGTSRVDAQCGGCQVYQDCNFWSDASQEYVCQWIDGCNGCNVTGCPSGQYYSGGSCHAIGGSGCECGEKADGSCKSCGGGNACYPVYSCPANAVDPNNYYDQGGVEQRNICPVGNAQSFYQSCYETEQGEEYCSNYMRVYSCCPGSSTVACEVVDTGTEYTRLLPYNDRLNCRDQYDLFIGTVYSPADSYSVFKPNQCVEYNDGASECLRREDRWEAVHMYNTTCRDRNNVCACEPVCSSTAPTGLSIEQGASATSADVSWTVGTGGATQRLYVDESQTEVNNGCTTPNACEVSATLDSGTNSYIVTGLEPETIYYFRVATYEDSTCTPSQVVSYTTPEVTLSGLVYLDTNNNCSTATPWNLGGLTVSVQGTGYEGAVGSDGRFGFFGGVDTPLNLVLDGYSADYIPSTATGCNAGSTLTSVANPSSTNYFYLTPRREAWWQVVGGSVYSAGNVRSELPLVSANLIEPGAGGALGALMRGSGTVDVGPGAVSSAGYSAETRYRGKTMNYDYFAAHMGVTPSTQNYWGTNTITEPDVDQNTARDFYYLEPTGGNPAVVTGLTISSGESYVIFVDGDLRIAGNVVVEQGGFLALMVNGSMYVSPAVTGVQGLYIVDGSLITETTGVIDDAVEFEGSVVAWGGVNLGRDLVGNNLTTPGESFTYRPDLLNNMPDAMKVFALRWEEVVPGTFDN